MCIRDSWTTDSINALNAAVEQAKDAIAHPESLTADQVEDLKAAIETALNSPVLKYTGTELSELVDGAITDGSPYTDETWQAYGEALAAAKVGLEKGDKDVYKRQPSGIATVLMKSGLSAPRERGIRTIARGRSPSSTNR